MGDYKKLGIVGAGSMGSMMAQLFCEVGGLDVSVFDVKSDNVDTAIKFAKENARTDGRIKGFKDYESFMRSLDQDDSSFAGRLLIFSITHGDPADSVLNQIGNYLRKGDIIIDGGNEWYLNSERRMQELEGRGVAYIGIGVSGGYQSARHGPSLSPGANNNEALERVMPLLEKVAAKDAQDHPCVKKIGPGGAGHYVKMIHNGIEQGMMSTLCEAWGILHFQMDLGFEEIGRIFEAWNSKGELRNNFLVSIGADVCKRRQPDGSHHILSDVLDKVVQDADNTEGTGVWSVIEAARVHVSAPTIAAGHFFRVASANRAQREKIAKAISLPAPSLNKAVFENEGIKATYVEGLRQTVYASFLASFVQGLEIIARQSMNAGWDIKLDDCIQIWRAGCIISSDEIAELLHPILSQQSPNEPLNLLEHPIVTREFSRTFESLSRIVAQVAGGEIEGAYIPAISATLEWVKYVAGEKLPTMFMEAELDYFGSHKYDKWEEGPGEVKKGKHHFEWKPA